MGHGARCASGTEDPTNDSFVEAHTFGVGHIFGLLFKWPSETGKIVVRLVLIVISLLLGCWRAREQQLLLGCDGGGLGAPALC